MTNPDVTFDSKGNADMSNWDTFAQLGHTNFDFGFYYDSNGEGRFRHANHSHEPGNPMKVYDSSIEKWKESYPDFNEEVFCVICNNSEFKQPKKP